jgi:hypothetical protein
MSKCRKVWLDNHTFIIFVPWLKKHLFTIWSDLRIAILWLWADKNRTFLSFKKAYSNLQFAFSKFIFPFDFAYRVLYVQVLWTELLLPTCHTAGIAQSYNISFSPVSLNIHPIEEWSRSGIYLYFMLRGCIQKYISMFHITRMYPKVSGLAAWSEGSKWYSSLPLGAVVSLFCELV